MNKGQRRARIGLRLGIRQKMILVLLSVLTMSLLITGWITFSEYRNTTFRQIERDGTKLARFVSESLVYSVVGYDYTTLQLMLDKLIESSDIVFAQVQNARGKDMASAGNAAAAGEHTRLFVENIVLEGESIGKLTIGIDTRPIHEELAVQRKRVIQREVMIVLLIALGEFFIISYIVVRPVRFIHRFLKGTSENLDQRIPPFPLSTRDEFSELSDVFNALLDKLERRQNDLRFALSQAEQATRAKSAFLANISHQFRTPLNAILGYEQVLRRDVGAAGGSDRALRAIAQSGQQLLALVDQIISVAKGESSGLDLQVADFDLAALVRECWTRTTAACTKKGLRFEGHTLDGVEHTFVHGDAGKLRNVLTTLLDNAVKFTPQGQIEFRVERQVDETFVFEVRDTGQGIAPELQKTLFDAFANDEQRLQDGGNHIGVSLALAHRQVEAMGGSLRVQSAPGQGAAFSFRLHLRPVAAATENAPVIVVPSAVVATTTNDAAQSVATPTSATATPQSPLPQAWLQQLEDAADMGLLSQVQELITVLRDKEPSVAAHLKERVDALDLDGVAAWAKQTRSGATKN